MKKKTWLKRTSAAVMALAMAMLLTLTVFAGANPNETGAGALPDPNEKGSLTVHKYLNSSGSSTPGTGLPLSEEDAAKLGETLEGVGFTLYQIIEDDAFKVQASATDPNNNFQAIVDDDTKWADFKALTGPQRAVPISEEFTDASGIATWTDLAVGYYVLEETTPPDPDVLSVDPAARTIITMPFGYTESGAGWNYNIHVYPKNVKTDPIVKEVVTPGTVFTVGDKVSWKIDAKAPVPMYVAPSDDGTTVVEEAWGYFQIVDELDERLTYLENADPENPTDAYGSVLLGHGGKTVPLTLVKGTDYDEVYNTSTNTVSWTFTQAGLKKMGEDGVTAVSVQLETQVNEKAVSGTPVSDPSISNGAEMNFANANDYDSSNADTISNEKIDEKDEPSIDLGGVQIYKVDNLDHDLRLDGAVFKVALSEQDARDGKFVKYGLDPAADDIEIVTGIPEGRFAEGEDTSPYEDGWGMFIGLPLAEEVGGVAQPTTYYLVETTAPEGYYLRQSIIEITLAAGDKINTPPELVVNQKHGDPPIDEDRPTFLLPKTGGIGTILFVVVGIALIAGAVLVFVKSKKKSKA